MHQAVKFEAGGRAIVYSPEGTKIAVGIGTPDEANDADGSFKI